MSRGHMITGQVGAGAGVRDSSQLLSRESASVTSPLFNPLEVGKWKKDGEMVITAIY